MLLLPLFYCWFCFAESGFGWVFSSVSVMVFVEFLFSFVALCGTWSCSSSRGRPAARAEPMTPVHPHRAAVYYLFPQQRGYI